MWDARNVLRGLPRGGPTNRCTVSKSHEEEPGALRELARRTRVIAQAMHNKEKMRLLAYADELEAQARELERRSKKQ